MKYFRMSYDEVVFQRSYINLLLLNRAIPGFKPFDKDDTNTNNASMGSTNTRTERKKAGNMHANSFFQQFM